ncbi:hypothetical protein C475_15729 [Halosimplex carlsbadense 2-9-1]|uniref:Uncharacterized protein n=1 Tax=Halosimplex carlsbadense 2-9-1 TaxID=797114 RepID=M0CKG9_9EURY|nr:hypothetical protein [Halosimplex carlsbadense]ELZ23113.1 hypothetical protein C475_15729 [Halosimplex carlsbadense 2-9-1]
MEQSWPPTTSTALGLLVAVVLVAGAGSLVLSATGPADPAAGTTPATLVEPRPGENVFWPYTSTRRSADGRTLAINLVVYADAETVRYFLTERGDATWNETAAEWEDVGPDTGGGAVDAANGTVVDWAGARGATRYLYVHNYVLTEPGPNETRRPYRAAPFTGHLEPNPGGRWIDETYQLHDGTYFGARDHLRLYESPFESDDWVAVQAHSDHWDWFRLRHTVHATDGTRDRLEAEFMGEPSVDTVWRMYLSNRRALGSDGWATVVDFAGLLGVPNLGSGLAAMGLVAGRDAAALARRRRSGGAPAGRAFGSGGARGPGSPTTGPVVAARRALVSGLLARGWLDHERSLFVVRGLSYLSLFAALFGLYLSVRFGGLALEHRFADTSPKVIAALLYPVLALGLPAAAQVFGRNLDPVRSFAVAALGVGSAIVVDYQSLGVTALSLDVAVHRVGIVVAIGVLAAGSVSPRASTETVDRLVAAGTLLWVVLLLAPLVGWL